MNRPLRALLGVPAPAKLNWFLHVLGRRSDGMHELQTVFQFLDWCDELDFELRETSDITREGGEGLPDEDLCVRAARLLQRQTGCRLGVHMRLRKSIPEQAGLGGGSSDAATVLLALNILWGLGLRRGELLELAAELGADVAVFVFGRSAFAEGVGVRLRELRLPGWSALVAWPGEGLSTAQVFASPLLTRDTPACTMEGFCEHLEMAGGGQGRKPVDSCVEQRFEDRRFTKESPGDAPAQRMRALLGFGANDLQAAAFGLLPRLRELQDWLARHGGGGAVRMSGSGSAMFVPWPESFDPADRGEGRFAGELPAGWKARVCRALQGHPLQHWTCD